MATGRDELTVNCPNCGIPVVWSDVSEWRPFCSDRCRMIDLGAWFSEERGIPAEEAEEGSIVAPESGPGLRDVN
ncbi:MAG: DNA gyrase inhibitor YacG [Gammaproteobacteria bacterium]